VKRHLTGKSKTLVYYWALAMTLAQIYIIFAMIQSAIHNSIFLAFMTSLIFLAYKPTKGSSDDIRWYDIALAIAGTVPYLYFVWNFSVIVTRTASPTNVEVAMMVIAVLGLLEVCRRTIGLALPIISVIFLLYCFFGNHLWGIWIHRGFSVSRVTSIMYMTDNGIFGITTRVAATMVFMFILFGAFLNKTKASDVMTQAAFSLVGRFSGGPAKVAVIGSALMALVSGSPASNVAATGHITIPLMKKMGYKPHFAAAVEASASTGGTITPPILGAAGFIMAEILQVPYSRVARSAILCAVLFYIAIFLAVHFETKRLKLDASPQDQLPKLGEVMYKGFHVLLPIGLLITLIFMNYPIMYAAFFSTIALVVVACLRSYTRLKIRDFFDGLADGALKCLEAAAACACAGIVIGAINLTGLGVRFSQLTMQLAGNSLFLALFATMIMLIVLGLGLPAVAAYVIGAAVAGPTLIGLGIPPIAAHLFIFYFTILSAITPPVAIAAFIASSIAETSPLKTSFTACYISLPVFILPFMFVNSPALLMEGPALLILRAIITSIIGVLGLTLGTIGFFKIKIPVWQRMLVFCCGLLLIMPVLMAEVVGTIGVAAVIALNLHESKKLAAGDVELR